MFVTPIINYLKDDYGVFNRRYANLYSNDVIMNEQCFKLKYLTNDDAPKYDSFILGISQGQIINTLSFPNSNRWYNLSSMTFTPFEYLDTLKYLKKHNISVKNILIVLQPTMFFCTKKDADQDKIKYFMLTDFPYKYSEKLRFYLNYLFLSPSEQNKKIYTTDYQYKINLLKNGSFSGKKDLFKKNIKHKSPLQKPYDLGTYSNISTEMLLELKKIKKYCDKNNINLQIFITPDYYEMYKMYNKKDLQQFKDDLSEIVGFYDFSGINNISTNEGYYVNFDHFNAYVGDMIIKKIYTKNTPISDEISQFGKYHKQKNKGISYIR